MLQRERNAVVITEERSCLRKVSSIFPHENQQHPADGFKWNLPLLPSLIIFPGVETGTSEGLSFRRGTALHQDAIWTCRQEASVLQAQAARRQQEGDCLAWEHSELEGQIQRRGGSELAGCEAGLGCKELGALKCISLMRNDC